MVVGGSPRVHLLSESHIAPTAEAPEQLCLVVLLAWGILACRATLPEGQVLVHAVVFAPALPAPKCLQEMAAGEESPFCRSMSDWRLVPRMTIPHMHSGSIWL